MADNNKTIINKILPDSYLYISHLDNNLQFWRLPCTPETVSDQMVSNFQSTNALGRSAPVYTFSNSGPRTVTVDLKMHREMMNDINEGYSNADQGIGEDYMDNFIRALQAIAVPKYNLSNKAVEPPMVALRLSNEIFIKGIVSSSISVTYGLPIMYNGKYAQVSVSFTISEVDPYDATSIYKNGSFRGVVKTLRKGMNLMED